MGITFYTIQNDTIQNDTISIKNLVLSVIPPPKKKRKEKEKTSKDHVHLVKSNT